MLDAVEQVWSLWSLARRSRVEPPVLRAVIETEGGQVLESRQLSSFRRSPFRGLRAYPVVYEFRVRYGVRRGRWYVRTSRGSPDYDWVWSDDDGRGDLPLARPGAFVDNEVVPVGWYESAYVVFGLIAAGLVAGVAVYWFFV